MIVRTGEVGLDTVEGYWVGHSYMHILQCVDISAMDRWFIVHVNEFVDGFELPTTPPPPLPLTAVRDSDSLDTKTLVFLYLKTHALLVVTSICIAY